ncbi:MAG: hypothetical protein IT385_16905 [Deltaproteobacteria bacterium]|nr:hypothetical protein [Deltaproteobacteria bacterium]
MIPTTLVVALATASAARAVEPLGPEQRATFLASAEDPPAKFLHGVSGQEGRHYLTGNEWNLHLFRQAVSGLGGGYVGVGSDQAYLFMGWQRPELAWLVDYDPMVIDVHRLYQAFFVAADSPAAFRALWDKENKVAALAAISARHPDDAELVARLDLLLRSARTKVIKRLDKVKEVVVAAGAPTFLNDAETYTFVRDMILAGRTRPMVADLMGKKGIAGIAESARALGVPIRVLYTSNAEQYWDYHDSFRNNVAALHRDERSVLARTLLTWDRNQDYRYNVQPLDNFVAWLAKPWVTSVWSFVNRRKDEGTEPEFFVLDRDVAVEERRLRDAGKLP